MFGRKFKRVLWRLLIVCSVLVVNTMRPCMAYGDELEELKGQLKQMEEAFSIQQKMLKQMEIIALSQQEQIKELKSRVESISEKPVVIATEEIKDEVKHEVENYLSSDEVREKLGIGLPDIPLLERSRTEADICDIFYTPDDSSYALSIRSHSGDYSLNIGGRLQMRYQYNDKDGDFGGVDTQNIDVRRARIYMGGNIYSKTINYYWAIDADSFDVQLRDFYLYWTPYKELNAKIGYFKVPFNREMVVSSQRLLFQDRAIASDAFGQYRDYGLDIYGRPFDGHIEYHAAVFQGAGDNPSKRITGKDENLDNEIMSVLSLRYNPFGKFNYYDGTDIGYSKTLKATFGSSVAFNGKKRDVKRDDTDIIVGVIDFGLRYKGIAWDSEYYMMTENPESDGGGDSVGSDGFFTQAGYFVIPKKLEIAARYSMVDPDDDVSNDIQREYTAGINYYFRGHRSKIQADFGTFITEQGDEQDKRENKYRLQYEIAF
ncbi:phosphate-selective porin O and P [Candidatus Kuenenia stuttgartiensis]|uniref:Phosphate-selective porin O and P n=1 Tax=Kuenenia stuttgartiensis TaxID=174633 RepID=Q1Q0D7_KUEST|nr:MULTISPECIES: porin [Kuenenia]MCZ7623477.1 porin [Candidatus Kuenenia sp.]QII09821.1 phosphate-selective porin O and P [Candidatus Kuenenia stuttgartiensis]CAJ72799.1 hypothetical protein kustd2054 [Candidatus Kuenenia stuttgartiensis]SOH04294.1 Phosphate-selective porin O and P [Candidatus Kuenenia stuttgartiensis]GJQ49786.1 MAG: hypothetical protein HKUEN01_21720 [Candidatus Kuenenia stuttgartiensis]